MATIELVMGEKKLKGCVSQPFDLGRIKMHHHAILDRLGASCDRSTPAFDFHKAKTTRG
jgi:hypothetical protein